MELESINYLINLDIFSLYFTTEDERGSCERGFCQCDKKAALCFANQPYLDEHYDIDLDIC